MAINGLSSNWKKLQASLNQQTNPKLPNEGPIASDASSKQYNELKRKRSGSQAKRKEAATHSRSSPHIPKKRLRLSSRMSDNHAGHDSNLTGRQLSTVTQAQPTSSSLTRSDCINAGLITGIEVGKYLALDCEMVGIGPHPHLESALARISVVNYNGDCVYDSFVKPLEPVTDWRTHVSGIAPQHMIDARTLEQVQNDVSILIKDRIVIGHSVRGDFDALLLSHPKKDIRDTARHPPYRKLAGGGSPKLKILASDLLGLEIQTGEHSSIEDARATMMLFRRDKDAFEREHAKKWPSRVVPVRVDDHTEQNRKPKKKKKKRK